MEKNELTLIAELAANSSTPQASILQPDVRSGASFTYLGAGTPDIPAFLLIWFYTVEPTKRGQFKQAVENYENSGVLPTAASGISYRGTYAVSVSSAAPDFEFRTVWGLEDLSKIQGLNDHLRTAPSLLQAMLGFIYPHPAMRSEIIGRAKNIATMLSSN